MAVVVVLVEPPSSGYGARKNKEGERLRDVQEPLTSSESVQDEDRRSLWLSRGKVERQKGGRKEFFGGDGLGGGVDQRRASLAKAGLTKGLRWGEWTCQE